MMRRALLPLMLFGILALPSRALPEGARCPPGSRLTGIDEEAHGDTIVLHPRCHILVHANPVVRDLAQDPDAERLSAAQLRVVDRRIANLQKTISLLGDANPEWSKERDHVLDDLREDRAGLAWELVNLISLGLVKGLQVLAHSNLSAAYADALAKAFKEPLRNLPGEEARLNQVLKTSQDPELTKAIVEYVAALHRLDSARKSNDVLYAIERTRDAVGALKDEFDMLEAHPPGSRNPAEALYSSSVLVGRFALVFVAEGPEAVAAIGGSALASLAVGGGEAVRTWEEYHQLSTLNDNASDRNRMKMELMGRLTGLRQEREHLLWAVQHAGR